MLYTQLKIRRLCLRWTPAEVYFKSDLPINWLIKQHCWSVICLLRLLLWHLYPHVSCAGILYVQLLFETSDICSLCLLTKPGENNCFLSQIKPEVSNTPRIWPQVPQFSSLTEGRQCQELLLGSLLVNHCAQLHAKQGLFDGLWGRNCTLYKARV